MIDTYNHFHFSGWPLRGVVPDWVHDLEGAGLLIGSTEEDDTAVYMPPVSGPHPSPRIELHLNDRLIREPDTGRIFKMTAEDYGAIFLNCPREKPLDIEVEAMIKVIDIIKGLPVDCRSRVLEYLSSRFKPGEFRS